MEKAKKLSNLQERRLLKQLLNKTPIDRGSSRLVFIHPQDKTKVVKVAVGVLATEQNRLEIKLWNKHGDDNFLARIFEYGNFVVVMERMKYCYTDDDIDDLEASPDYRYVCDKMIEVMDGHSADNYQIGLTYNGKYLAYDYGFTPEKMSWQQCGWSYHLQDVKSYLVFARNILIQKLPANKIDACYNRLSTDW